MRLSRFFITRPIFAAVIAVIITIMSSEKGSAAGPWGEPAADGQRAKVASPVTGAVRAGA